jgi:hypothetical protein
MHECALLLLFNMFTRQMTAFPPPLFDHVLLKVDGNEKLGGSGRGQ